MQDVNFTWPQGEDLYIDLRYKEGPTQAKALPVNLSGGFSARMSLANPNSPTVPLVTLSTETGEIILGNGLDGPNIHVRLDRALTLAGGAVAVGGGYIYDLFLRNSLGDQIKVVEGTINVRPSVTQWA